jgi:hypothetical protein
MPTPIDIPATLAEGGEIAVALLQFCIRSGHLEPLFYHLNQDYQQRPGHLAALTLFDLFCASNAPARLAVPEALPPQELRLASSMTMLRQQWQQMQQVRAGQEIDQEKKLFIAQPQRGLFDAIVRAFGPRFAQVASQFDPEKRVNECLPGGMVSAGQRNFINQVWTPKVRPQLVAAGFWRVATLE